MMRKGFYQWENADLSIELHIEPKGAKAPKKRWGLWALAGAFPLAFGILCWAKKMTLITFAALPAI